MKGYLQRMAANAARPHGIHPLVGSIYAGPAVAERGAAPDSITVTEERMLANSPEPVRAGKDVRGIKPDPLFKIAQPEEGIEERAVVRGTEPASLQPPLSKAVRVHDGAADTKELNRQYVQHVRFDDEGNESPHAPEFHYEPLLPREARSPLVTSAVQKVKPERVSRSAPAEREPDKIEIHIGRIEVTAVPQEAPRPATARARKSLNLGEYLKRRDGRAG